MADSSNPRTVLWELIKDIRVAMITHAHTDGHLHAVPMTTANQEGMQEDQHLYFLIAHNSELARCASQSLAVNVAYADPDKDRLSLSRARPGSAMRRRSRSSCTAPWPRPGSPMAPPIPLCAC